MIKIVSDIVKSANLIDKAYRSVDQPHLFISSKPEANLAFGGGKVRELDPDKLPRDFLTLGANTQLPKFSSKPIRIVVVNTLADEVTDFLEALKRAMSREYNFSIDLVRERKVRVVTQSNLESAVRLLGKENADLTMVFLPEEEGDDEDEAVGDRYARTQTIGRGLPCLIIHEATMHKPESMPDIVMGLIARAGNLPYLINEPLRYADRVVGLSLVRQSKRDGEHVTGIARIYQNNGALIRAFIAGSPVKEGEGIHDDLLEKLLPASLLRKQRVVLHHDGKLKREVLWALQAWEEKASATLHPVEIVRRGIPRLYTFKGGKPEPPEWGSTFRLSDSEAFLVTSFALGDVTPQPLHIRVEPPLSIEQAIHSVMTFSLFHYGALRQPKLPVTIHQADLIEVSIGRGVMPVPFETDVPFWL
jgi:argonaute-like protein implicated in RNA metabolism and viral defense